MAKRSFEPGELVFYNSVTLRPIRNKNYEENRNYEKSKMRNSVSLDNLDIIYEFPFPIENITKRKTMFQKFLPSNAKKKGGALLKNLLQVRKMVRKMSRGRTFDGAKHTPILAQKEFIIKTGITIWEEDINGPKWP